MGDPSEARRVPALVYGSNMVSNQGKTRHVPDVYKALSLICDPFNETLITFQLYGKFAFEDISKYVAL